MIHIVLIEPEIPQNTGNIARTCAAVGARLHLVGPLGFTIDDKKLKRAGLDYWHFLDIKMHENLDAFMQEHGAENFFYFTTKAEKSYCEVCYPKEAYLVFGKETAGLPESLLVENREACVRIPMREDARSLNLSNCVAVAAFEALRQNNFFSLSSHGGLHHLKWPD